VFNGADLVRTHDVAATRDAVRMAEFLREASSSLKEGFQGSAPQSS